MASSISTLLGEMLNDHQLEAAKESMGLDTQLIEDGTYFLVKKGEVLIGSPYVKDIVVEATVLSQIKDKKIIVFKKKEDIIIEGNLVIDKI